MNTKQLRRQRLMPRGVPRYVRCYDTGPETGDRYTVCFTGRAATERGSCGNWYPYRAMSEHPFDPQGIGIWSSTHRWPSDTMRVNVRGVPGHTGWHMPPAIGRKCHLGVRIHFKDLPKDCRKLVAQDYKEIWRL